MKPVYKIVVLGTSGAGKTTLAKFLAKKFSIHHIELDQLFWNPNWVESPEDVFVEKIKNEINSHENWIICGNYHAAKQITLYHATHIIWLNYPFYKIFYRSLKRNIQRIITKTEPFPGCQESFVNSYLSSKSILWWVIISHRSRVIKLTKLLTKENFPNTIIFNITKQNELDKCIQSL
jgi:adenylate kinase family enzyme